MSNLHWWQKEYALIGKFLFISRIRQFTCNSTDAKNFFFFLSTIAPFATTKTENFILVHTVYSKSVNTSKMLIDCWELLNKRVTCEDTSGQIGRRET